MSSTTKYPLFSVKRYKALNTNPWTETFPFPICPETYSFSLDTTYFDTIFHIIDTVQERHNTR